MTDKEILAQLKKSYENLKDIIENSSEEQVNNNKWHDIDKITNKLEELYKEIIENTEQDIMYKDNIYISDNINYGYVDNKDNYYADGDFGTHWYDNIEFLQD